MSNPPEVPPEIPPQRLHLATRFGQDVRLTDDLLPGTFFDDPDYFESLPWDAKTFALAVLAAGEDPQRPSVCHTQSEEFFRCYFTKNEQQYLWSAMASEAMALRWISAQHPARGRFNQHMGRLFAQKLELSGDPNDLDEAIRHTELAVQHSMWSDEELSNCLTELAYLLVKRYYLASQTTDFDKATENLDRALRLAESTTARILALTGKLDLAREVYRTSEPETRALPVDTLVLLDNLLMEAEPLTPSIGGIYRSVGNACMLLFCGPQDQIWIEKAISYLAKSIIVYSYGRSDLPARAAVEDEHAQALRKREHILSSQTVLKVLQDLIETHRSILDDRVKLARLYLDEGQNTMDPHLREKRLNDAVELMENALNVMPASFERREEVYHGCSAAHYSRFDAYKHDTDINRAIECSALASGTTVGEMSWTFAQLHSQCLLDRYEKHSQPSDLREALIAIQKATELTGGESNPIGVGNCKWIMGKIFRYMYEATSGEEQLLEAVNHFAEAARLLLEPSPSRVLALHDLGNAYSKQAIHNPDPKLLDKSIAALEESVAGMEKLHSHAPHPDLLMSYSSLGGVMLQRFRSLHLQPDLESSVRYFRKALDGLSSSDARYAPRAGNLCQALRELFEAHGEGANMNLLVEGQNLVSKALENPEILGHKLRSWLELQLADVFSVSFSSTKLPSDKENAIEYYDKAAIASPDISLTHRALAMTNKATLLKKVAENTGSEEDFKTSYDTYEEIGNMLPENHPHVWINTYNHATLAFEMHERGLGAGRHTYGNTALEKYKSVAENVSVPTDHRITAASVAAALAYEVQNDAESARNFISICLTILPKSVLLHESRVEQLKLLRKYHYVPSGAAALSLAAGDPVSVAIQRLETGRANIWDRLLRQKTSAESLAAVDESLANEFQDLQLKLSVQAMAGAGRGPTLVAPNDEKRLQRERDARKYQILSQEISKTGLIPEFMDPFNDTGHLQKLADDAPIVFINASEYRSDVLIVVKDRDPFNIQLPDFTMDTIKSQAAVFLEAQDKHSSGIEKTIGEGFSDYKSVMKWLWVSAAKPVIEAIDFSTYTRGPSGKPRVIWVATGWMTVFPIHAAGDFDKTNGSSSVHDRVVSSYTLSLKSLDFSKQRNAHRADKMDPNTDIALIVAMASTPGISNGDLNVEAEIKSFKEELEGCMRVESQCQQSSQHIMDRLKCSSIAHFACHGLIDMKDPSKSALLLQDCAVNDELRDTQPFCVWIILKIQMEKCGLVYLSACDSGTSRDLLLRDEGLHVAGAFHMAGVPHAVSTLWKVQDSVSADLSRYFYANIKNDQGTVDLHRSADALHLAVQKLRDRGEEPMIWGPFIHSGS
ncbi:TPR Domain containing protein [Metarhizium guizhouense ARSEF 977]|uniref:TPR Domain containing protein n=1 Tax=Metarhizium guizhouense (strain ARSEF 977) TaxID=1276136 RepID=A0A0B4GTZ4_METGA|nr:TPR Domain containing protein [Metarhizium guizhouense ARSEF 977]